MAGITIPKIGAFTQERESRSPGSMLSRGKRFAELSRIARRNGLLPFRKLDFTSNPATASTRAIQAEGLRRALEEAGGAFVKMGQLASTRSDLLPDEYVDALSQLQKSVTAAPWPEVQAMLEQEFGAPLESVFGSFDREPVAAASIGQVHRAVTKSGTVVAVKIQRPGIVPEVRRDVDIALRFTRAMQFTSPQAKALGSREIAEQYGADLIRQLDFRREAMNLSAMRALQSKSPRADELRLPELFESLSSDRVIVMEFLEGETMTALRELPAAERPDLTPAMRTVLRAFVRQIVFDGVYHSDLHPGNIMVLSDGTPALVDFGSVGRLDLQLRETVQELLIAYPQSDTQLIADGLLTLAPLSAGSDEAAFRRDLSTFISYELGPGARVSIDTVDALVEILSTYGIAIPADFIAAARGLAVLEGTLRSTVPEFDLLDESRSLAREQIGDQMAPDNVRALVTTELLGLLPSVRKLPRRVDRIGYALETGNLSVNIRVLADHRDRRLVAGLVRQSLLGLIGAAAGVLALVYLTMPPGSGVISTSAAGIVLAIASPVLLVAAFVDSLIMRRRE